VSSIGLSCINGDWISDDPIVINVSSSLLNASVDVRNDLSITSSSTLTVDGTNLSVSGVLAVLPGATLVLSNSTLVSGIAGHSDPPLISYVSRFLFL